MKNYYINTAQGSWSRIMLYSKGIDQGELVVITGEHNDINRDFLNNLWGFARYQTLYISYGRNKNEILHAWRCSRLVPIESEIGSQRFVACFKEFNVKEFEKTVAHFSPDLVFIENINFATEFDAKIEYLRTYAKKHNVAVVVHINPKFVNLDDVLASSLLNKIYYLTNRAAHIYTAASSNGVKIPIYHLPKNYNIWEDQEHDVKAEKKFKEQKQVQKFLECQSLLTQTDKSEEKIVKVKKQTKKQEKEQGTEIEG